MAGKKGLGLLGPPPVGGCGGALACCPQAAVFLVTAPVSCCLLVLGGEAFMCFGSLPEGVNAGGKRLLCRSF